MPKQLEEFLATHGTRHERTAHPEAFTAQEEAAATRVSGWSWAKVVIVKERSPRTRSSSPASPCSR
jgi:hypothetical protein